MKTLLSILAAAAVLGVAAPSTAKADPFCRSGSATRVVGYTSCGTPILAVYRIVGYDRCGQPIGQWVTLPPQTPSRGYSSGYGHSQHGHGGYSNRPRSGLSFSFGFGR